MHVSVYRYVPGEDVTPRMQDYEIDIPAGQDLMVLDVLQLVKAEDPTVAYRRSCREGVCGSDGMNMNGKNGLACITPLSEVLKNNKLVVRPLPGLPVIRDLVVDIDPFLESLKAIVPWLVLRPNHNGRMSPQALAEIEAMGVCILCGACEAGGTQASTGLAALAKTYRFALDPRDALGPERIKLAVDLGLLKWPPYEGFAVQCPKGIEFEKGVIPALRALTVQQE